MAITASGTETTQVDTHCPYCALQCAMTLTRGAGGAVTVAGRDFPVNGGGLCHKGWTSVDLLDSPERITAPMAVHRGRLPHDSLAWEEALDQVAAKLKVIIDRDGPDAVAIFGGGGLTNEKAYSLGKFARAVLRTSMIDYNGRFCMSSAAAATNRAFGIDRGLPFPITDLTKSDVIILVGANVAETMPPFVRHLTASKARGGKLVVIDPRRTATAKLADIHMQGFPGTDLAAALALLHVVIAEGLVDNEYVAARTTGFDAVRARASHYWPERVERETGIPASQLREVALLLGNADTATILTARGPEQQSKGVDTVNAFINLTLALGLPGKPSSGYGCITGQGNGQGGREHGQKADQLPGYRSITDAKAREHVAGVWGIDAADLPGPGISAYELLDSLGTLDGPKALLVFGSNPIVSAPRASNVERRLSDLELLVVADPFLSETAARADYVFPVTQWAEEEGTMTNLEGRVIRRRKLLDPPPGVRSDLELLAGLAQRLGLPEMIGTNPADVFDELARASAGGTADYSGLSHDLLDADIETFWPWPAGQSAGTPRILTDSFETPDGLARFVDVDNRPPDEPIDSEYPLYLTTGRVLSQYQSGTQTRRVRALVAVEPEPFVELHPSIARRLMVEGGDLIQVISRRGTAVGKARLNESMRLDTVFMPFHWPGAGRANSLTNSALDPTSRMPEFKVCAVRLQRAEPG